MKSLMLTISIVFFAAIACTQEPFYDRIFFTNSPMDKSYFYTETEYTTPSWVKNVSGKLPVSDSIFFTPNNALRLNYISRTKGKWKARLLYKSIRGQDYFVPATRLVFRLFVSSATSADELPAIGIAIEKKMPTFLPLKEFIKNYKAGSWLEAVVPLSRFGIKPSSTDKINLVAFSQHSNEGKEHLMFIDQVELSNENSRPVTMKPKLISAKGFEKHIDIAWDPVPDSAVKYIKIYRSSDKINFNPVGIQSVYITRYADFTDTTGKEFFYKITLLDRNYNETDFSNTVSAFTKAQNDDELLDMVQEAHFRYYWEGAEKNSGLALENIHGRRHMIATGASGFGIMALITGAERKFITRQQLVERFLKITSFLEKADKFHGAFPHFLDGSTGTSESSFGPT